MCQADSLILCTNVENNSSTKTNTMKKGQQENDMASKNQQQEATSMSSAAAFQAEQDPHVHLEQLLDQEGQQVQDHPVQGPAQVGNGPCPTEPEDPWVNDDDQNKIQIHIRFNGETFRMNALAALTWGEFMCLLKKKMDHPGPLSAFTKSKKIITRATKLFQVAEMENEKSSTSC